MDTHGGSAAVISGATRSYFWRRFVDLYTVDRRLLADTRQMLDRYARYCDGGESCDHTLGSGNAYEMGALLKQTIIGGAMAGQKNDFRQFGTSKFHWVFKSRSSWFQGRQNCLESGGVTCRVLLSVCREQETCESSPAFWLF